MVTPLIHTRQGDEADPCRDGQRDIAQPRTQHPAGQRERHPGEHQNNPLDVTPTVDDAQFASAVRSVLHDPNVDAGIVGVVPMTPALQTLPPGQEHHEDLTRSGGIASALAELNKPCFARGWPSSREAPVTLILRGTLDERLRSRFQLSIYLHGYRLYALYYIATMVCAMTVHYSCDPYPACSSFLPTLCTTPE